MSSKVFHVSQKFLAVGVIYILESGIKNHNKENKELASAVLYQFPTREVGVMQEKAKWMELCEQAAIEQDSQKFMELIKQIIALLDDKQERLIVKDSQRLNSERPD